MRDWIAKLDAFLLFNERSILTHAGKISHQPANEHAEEEFEKYRAEQRRLEAESPVSDFDKVIGQVKRIEQQAPKKQNDAPAKRSSRRVKRKTKERDDA